MTTNLAAFCKPENKIRENYYSDVHRLEVIISGVAAVKDIIHISIPFSGEKEQYLCENAGISYDEIDNFYNEFSRRIAASYKLLTEIKNGRKGDKLKNNVIDFDASCINKKQGRGSDIYIMTSPREALTESELLKPNEVSLLGIVTFGIRLTQIIKALSEDNLHLGAVSPEDFMYHEENGKQIIELAFMPYGFNNEPIPTTPFYGAYAGQGIAEDVRMVAVFMDSVIEGRGYRGIGRGEKRSYPAELSEAIATCKKTNEDNSQLNLRQLTNALFKVQKGIISGKIEDLHIVWEEEGAVLRKINADGTEYLSAAKETKEAMQVSDEADPEECPCQSNAEAEEADEIVILNEQIAAEKKRLEKAQEEMAELPEIRKNKLRELKEKADEEELRIWAEKEKILERQRKEAEDLKRAAEEEQNKEKREKLEELRLLKEAREKAEKEILSEKAEINSLSLEEELERRKNEQWQRPAAEEKIREEAAEKKTQADKSAAIATAKKEAKKAERKELKNKTKNIRLAFILVTVLSAAIVAAAISGLLDPLLMKIGDIIMSF